MNHVAFVSFLGIYFAFVIMMNVAMSLAPRTGRPPYEERVSEGMDRFLRFSFLLAVILFAVSVLAAVYAVTKGCM